MSQANAPYILVVDDETRIRQAVSRVLGPAGYEVAQAANGQEGLESIQQRVPDLVLVDLMMPVMDGMTFLREARKLQPDLMVVVITGYATLEKAVEAMKQGADDFLPKPFKPQELRLMVQRVLKQARTVADMAVEKSRTRALINTMTNGVLVVDQDVSVALMNPALRRMVGWGEQPPHGLPLAEVLSCAEVVQTLQQVLAQQEDRSSVACQCVLQHKGEPLYLQVTCAPFLNRQGGLVGALAVFDDVTAWHKLDELKSEFVSTVAHEIAGPLAAVLGQLQNLADGLAGELNSGQAQVVARARSRLEGIVDLSRDLLDLSKLEAGIGDQPGEVELGPLVSEAVDMLSGQAQDKEQSLSLELPPEPLVVTGVAGQLMEVMVNLISNAVKYTPAGGAIQVRARRDDGRAVLEVADNGLGMEAADLENIFRRFFRIKNADTRHIVGTGLGLAIVKRVVEGHNGRIEVQSQPGQGSLFRVILPLAV
ncbi:MAG: response regulator [Thermodesulfobacteriota bacterium]